MHNFILNYTNHYKTVEYVINRFCSFLSLPKIIRSKGQANQILTSISFRYGVCELGNWAKSNQLNSPWCISKTEQLPWGISAWEFKFLITTYK